MVYGCKFIALLTLSILTLSCSEQDFAQPSCRVKASVASSHQGAGACIVRMNNKLLATQLNSGLYDIPSIRASTHSLANNSMYTSAQCLAHRAMWEQTGFNVEVQGVVGAQADGTWLFECQLDAGFDGTEAPFPAPSWNKANVANIAFIDPFEIDVENWARRSHFIVVRDAFVGLGNE